MVLLFFVVVGFFFLSLKAPRECISLPTYLLLSKESTILEKTQLSIANKYAIISGWCFKPKWFSLQKLASLVLNRDGEMFLLLAVPLSLGIS